MEPLKSYLTKEGWKRDLQKTKEDFSSLYTSKDLTDFVKNEKGNACLTILLGTLAMPVCAFLGSYIGQGLGWVGGQIIDFLPYLNQVVPWLAERCGDIGKDLSRHELNVQWYTIAGAIDGFFGGLLLPWKVVADTFGEDK